MAHPSIAERITFGRPAVLERDKQRAHVMPRPMTALLSRILLSVIFVLSGLNKLLDVDGTVAAMASQGFGSRALAIGAGLAELAGGLALAFGFLTRLGAIGLILFLIPTTLVFHDFWTLSGGERQLQMTMFLKNLAILGGLGLLVAFGPGRYSIDRRLREPKPV